MERISSKKPEHLQLIQLKESSHLCFHGGFMDLKIIFSTALEVVFLDNKNENFSHGNTLPRGVGRGVGVQNIKKVGVLVVSLRGVNFGF